MKLSGLQRGKLKDALIDGFPRKSSLEQMLSFKLDKSLDLIAGGSNLQDIVFDLIKRAESENWIEDLINAALADKPRNPNLKAIAKELLTNSQKDNQEIYQKEFDKEVFWSRRKLLKLTGLGGASLVTTALVSQLSSNGNSNPPPPDDDSSTPDPSRKPKPVPAESFTENLGNDVTLEMVKIPAGSFIMGSPPGEKGRDSNESRQHNVNVPTFFISQYEVTQEQYQQVMGNNPSSFKGDKRPVENVSWNDAVEFCKKLSQMTGRKYRLPSEAEWEYAARAGTTTRFHFGETITSSLANYNYNNTRKNGTNGTTKVGSFLPNAFGLYDMHGNVFEWVEDTWQENYIDAPRDGSAWIDSNQTKRVARGGSWNKPLEDARSARRGAWESGDSNHHSGFRVALDDVVPENTQ